MTNLYGGVALKTMDQLTLVKITDLNAVALIYAFIVFSITSQKEYF